MGIGDKNLELLEFVFDNYDIKTVIELGAQNFYNNYKNIKYGEFADKYYNLKGVTHYENIDICGDNNSLVFDLTKPVLLHRTYDMVTDFGTCEHISTTCDIEKLYICWTTKYNASKLLIVSSNPSTGHWPKHGGYFFTTDFYKKLSELTNTKIVKLDYHFSMGNYVDGREVGCILEKTPNSKWISIDDFSLAFKHVYSC